jgi:hypothetical protein
MGGGGKSKTVETNKTDPWSGQQPYLTDIMSKAQGAYNAQSSSPGYTGDFFASPRPEQLNAFNGMLNFASGQGAGAVGTQLDTGATATGMGLGAAGGALSGMSGMAGSDLTGGNISAAGRYADNPYMDGMVQASMRDANRNAAENVLPNLYRGAAAGGNINSDRTALAQGVVERGLAEKTADISAGLRGQAYSQGIDAAQRDTSMRAGLYDSMGQLGAGMTDLGTGALSSGIESQMGLSDMAGAASDRLQMFDQARIDNDLSKFEYNQNRPWEALGNYYGIVGDKSWGGSSTGTSIQSQKPSALSSIGAGVGILGSLLKCDERVKTKVAQVGSIFEGIPLYIFYYNDQPGLHIGPMAQDVEKHFPDAVVEIDGIKHINLAYFVDRGGE